MAMSGFRFRKTLVCIGLPISLLPFTNELEKQPFLAVKAFSRLDEWSPGESHSGWVLFASQSVEDDGKGTFVKGGLKICD